MIAYREWARRNIGFDPIARPAPAATFSFAAVARPRSTVEDLQREIIDFDSDQLHKDSNLALKHSDKAYDIWGNKLEVSTSSRLRTT